MDYEMYEDAYLDMLYEDRYVSDIDYFDVIENEYEIDEFEDEEE